MDRYQWNIRILTALWKEFEVNPNLRFGQACVNLELFPGLSMAEEAKVFYVESEKSAEHLPTEYP
jgi:hypothetical protein